MIEDMFFCVISIVVGGYLVSQKLRAIYNRLPLSLKDKISFGEGLILIMYSPIISAYINCKNIDYINQKLANAINNIGKFLKFQIKDKTETIVQLKKLLASKKAADLLKALKKLQRNYFPEFGNTVVDIFEERYKRNISWEVQVEAIKIIGKQHLVKVLPLLEQIVKKIWSMIW